MHVDTSPTNEYGDCVVAHVLRNPHTGRRIYRCPREYWDKEFRAWCQSRQLMRATGKKGAELPEPMSPGHCMFLTPLAYGYVPDDETRPAVIRRAHRHQVLGLLDGWDRDLRKTPQGMRKLARIVRTTVAARMKGNDVGAFPFQAVVFAGL